MTAQIVKGVPVLGEQDELALASTGIAHLQGVLQARTAPTSDLAGVDDLLGPRLQPLQDQDLPLQLGDGLGGSGTVDRSSSGFSSSSALRSSASSGSDGPMVSAMARPRLRLLLLDPALGDGGGASGTGIWPRG